MHHGQITEPNQIQIEIVNCGVPVRLATISKFRLANTKKIARNGRAHFTFELNPAFGMCSAIAGC